MQSSKSKCRRILGYGSLFGGLCLLVVLAVAVLSGQWQVSPILSGSMRPGLPVGGVAVTEREPIADLNVRDVVVTHPPGEPGVNLIHRVIEIKSESGDSAVVQTMGDANPAPDPFTVRIRGPWIYKVRFSVPLVGYPALALHSPSGRRSMLGIGLTILLVAAVRMARGRRKTQKSVTTGADDGANEIFAAEGPGELVSTGAPAD